MHNPFQAGGNINDFQAKTFSRIQLSKSGEYYPGTAERTLLVSGRLKQIIAALGLIFAKLQREGVAPVTPRTRAALESRHAEQEPPPIHLAIKLLVPQPLCGIIIGKGGATVRNYAASTRTQIRVTAPDGPTQGLNHRVVTINGAPEDCLKAMALLILKQAEDSTYHMYSELPSTYTAAPIAGPMPGGGVAPYARPPYGMAQPGTPVHPHLAYSPYVGASQAPVACGPGPSGAAPMYGASAQPMFTTSHDGMATMTFPLPDEQAAVLMGSGQGRGLEDLQAAAGVRIRMDVGSEGGAGAGSPRQGPRIAQVTVSGPAECVHYANFLMAQRLAMFMIHQQYMANPNSGAGYYQAYRPAPPPYGGGMGVGYPYGIEAEVNSGMGTTRPSPRTVVMPPNSARGPGAGGER